MKLGDAVGGFNHCSRSVTRTRKHTQTITKKLQVCLSLLRSSFLLPSLRLLPRIWLALKYRHAPRGETQCFVCTAGIRVRDMAKDVEAAFPTKDSITPITGALDMLDQLGNCDA